MRVKRAVKKVVMPAVPKYHYDSECVAGQGRIFHRGNVWYVDYGVDGRRKRFRASADKGEALKMLAALRTDIERAAFGFERKKVVLFSDFAEEYKKIKSEARAIQSVEARVKHLVKYFKDTPSFEDHPGDGRGVQAEAAEAEGQGAKGRAREDAQGFEHKPGALDPEKHVQRGLEATEAQGRKSRQPGVLLP